jgi:adenine phosphoribosyltransferase
MSDVNLADFIGKIPDYPKPGILFRDITPLLATPSAFGSCIDQMAASVADLDFSVIMAAEARGFLFAAPLALRLEMPLILIRKHGKLPPETKSYSYELEYGSDTLEVRPETVPPGARVLMVDDLLATGGTLDACCQLVEQIGCTVAGCAFVIELLGLPGRQKLNRYPLRALLELPDME